MVTGLPIRELASRLDAQIHGDISESLYIHSVSNLESGFLGSLAFYNNQRYLDDLKQTKASVVLLAKEHMIHAVVPALVVDDPEYAFIQVAQWLNPQKVNSLPGIHPTAIIGEGCSIDPSVTVGPGCVIGDRVSIAAGTSLASHVSIGNDARIGEHCHLGPQVVLYTQVVLADRVIVHAAAVIGADGFGFLPRNGQWHKIPQLGGVRIGSDVEIGAHTAIDCGRLSDTVIADGVKLDNHIHIAHNVSIGKHTVIAACTGIAGSSSVGQHCIIGGHVGIADNVSITDGVILASKSGVMKSIKQPGKYGSGIPVEPLGQWFRLIVYLKQLDKIAKRLSALESLYVKTD